MTTSQPLYDAALDRLETLLDSEALRETSLPLDALQGFLCAVISAPEAIEPDTWLPIALGENLPADADAVVEEATELVMRLYNELANALYNGEAFDLYLYPDKDEARYDYATWAAGYLEGVEIAEPQWEDSGDQEEVDALLFPFVILAGALDEDEELRASLVLEPGDEAKLVADCQEKLPDTVHDAYEYWLTRRKPKTMRRETPKVGRNDPCPCGSGKKYKQCCGQAAG